MVNDTYLSTCTDVVLFDGNGHNQRQRQESVTALASADHQNIEVRLRNQLMMNCLPPTAQDSLATLHDDDHDIHPTQPVKLQKQKPFLTRRHKKHRIALFFKIARQIINRAFESLHSQEIKHYKTRKRIRHAKRFPRYNCYNWGTNVIKILKRFPTAVLSFYEIMEEGDNHVMRTLAMIIGGIQWFEGLKPRKKPEFWGPRRKMAHVREFLFIHLNVVNKAISVFNSEEFKNLKVKNKWVTRAKKVIELWCHRSMFARKTLKMYPLLVLDFYDELEKRVKDIVAEWDLFVEVVEWFEKRVEVEVVDGDDFEVELRE
ncbi:hypothetical protein HDU76_005076 [Blyttiomyces sp. JEL0837]|nr:hypothetical protein HDU76_005076 [Blyttiomyces sp. JEL0837]